MADNTNTTAADQGAQVQANGEATADTTPARLYSARADAEAARPTDASKALRPFEVLHNGTSKGWVLARGHGNAIEQVARLDGYSASTGKPAAVVTKEAVAAKLAAFSDAELAALGLARKPAGRGKK